MELLKSMSSNIIRKSKNNQSCNSSSSNKEIDSNNTILSPLKHNSNSNTSTYTQTLSTAKIESSQTQPSISDTSTSSSSFIINDTNRPILYKRIRIDCPGRKVPYRTEPSTSSEIKGYYRNGQVIEVYLRSVDGFFKLKDNGGFLNKNTKGVTWVDL